jgi:hypothetical protein
VVSAPSSASARSHGAGPRAPVSRTPERVGILGMRISGGRTGPCSSSGAIRCGSRASVLRPGTASMCALPGSQPPDRSAS